MIGMLFRKLCTVLFKIHFDPTVINLKYLF